MIRHKEKRGYFYLEEAEREEEEEEKIGKSCDFMVVMLIKQ